MVVFTFSIFALFPTGKNPFWRNLVQKFKSVSFSKNLVPRLVENTEVNGGVHFFVLLDREYPLWANLVQKIKIVSFSQTLVPRLV